MRRGKVHLAIMVFLLTGMLSFLAGFAYRVVLAAEPSPMPFHLSQMAPIDSAPPSGTSRQRGPDVKPLEMFWETFSVIRQRYRLSGTPDWKDQNLLYAALDGLLRSLDDPYTRFLDPQAYRQMMEQNQGQFQGIGAYLKAIPERGVIVLAPILNSPAARAGLKRNDILLKIGKFSATGLDIEKAKDLIRGPAGTTVELLIGRLPDPGKPAGSTNPMKQIHIRVVRDTIRPDEIKVSIGPPGGHEKEQDIGYIYLQQFNEDTENQLDRALAELVRRKVKGIVLDLRDNPGGLLDVAIGVASRFIESGPVVYIQENGGNRRAHNADRRKYQHLNRPIVVLVNRFSASASEIVAGALRDKGVAKIVGETTFGKGLVQTIIPLENEGNAGALKITTAKYFTPNLIDINHKGIEPDIKVVAEHQERDPFSLPDPSAVDVQLNQALQVLRKEIAASGTSIARQRNS